MPLPQESTSPKADLSVATLLLYGSKKIGKSTLCSQAPAALFLATEPGLNYLEHNEWHDAKGSPGVKNWEDFLLACSEIAKGDHDFRTIIIDTADNLYKMCIDYVCKSNNVDHESAMKWGRGYALIDREFHRVLTKLAQLPYALWLISHSVTRDEETPTAKFSKTMPTLPEKGAGVVFALADFILFFDIERGEDGARRILRTKPQKHYMAGDRSARLPEIIDVTQRADGTGPNSYQKFEAAFNAAMAGIAKAPEKETAPPSTPSTPSTPPTAKPDPKSAAAAKTTVPAFATK